MNIFRKSEENNNIIDERQIFEMYKVEHYRFWIFFYGLLAVLLIETCVLEAPVQYVTPIWIVFMVGAIYSVIAYYRKGIWDGNNAKPTYKKSLLYSIFFLYYLPFCWLSKEDLNIQISCRIA